MTMHILFAAIALGLAINARGEDNHYTFILNTIPGIGSSGIGGSSALRAIGGAGTGASSDISCASCNPAAAAVLGGFHVSVTPVVSINSSSSRIGEDTRDGKSCFSRLFLGNISLGASHDFGDKCAVRRLAFSFTADRSDIGENRFACEWTCGGSSLAGSLAAIANAGGYSHEELQDYSSNAPTPCVLGYKTETFSRIGSESSYSYLGITENYDIVSGGGVPQEVQQRYICNNSGINGRYELGISLQLGRMVYVGAALGIQALSYELSTSLYEYSDDPTLFDTRFNSLSYRFSAQNSACGIYGNFGLMLLPWKGLGIGVALRTPCELSFDCKYNSRMECDWFSDDSYSVLTGKKPAQSDTQTKRFSLQTPLLLSAGISYDFGGKALVSADYSWSDMASCRVSTDRSPSTSSAGQLGGCSHNINAGAQIALWKTLCLRCGYSFRQYGSGPVCTHSACCGLGYVFRLSKVGLDTSLAFRHSILPSQNTGKLYPDYPRATSAAPSVNACASRDELSLTVCLIF